MVLRFIKHLIYYNKHSYKFYKTLRSLLTQKSKNATHPQDIIVCGMFRSGSTLVYNLVSEILKSSYNPSAGFFHNYKEYVELSAQPNFFIVRKTHYFSIKLKNRISRKKTLGLFTHRNLLDVIASMVQKNMITNLQNFIDDFGVERLAYDAIAIAETQNIINIPYSDLLNNKSIIINQLCDKLEVSLNPEEMDKIIDNTSIAKTKKQIEVLKIDDKKIDSISGLHFNHINDPSIGKWNKVLSNKEVELISNKRAFKEYNKFFNYKIS